MATPESDTLGSAGAPEPDTVITDRYRIVRTIGEGGMGVVLEAEHLDLGHRVALKVLNRPRSREPEFADRFRLEARAAYGIKHPHIVDVTDLGLTKSGRLFFVMELVEGQSLAELLRDTGSLEQRRAARIMLQVCDALDAVHEQSVVHRDLKPGNLMLTEQEGLDFVKVVDFGIAQDDDFEAMRVTSTSQIVGTPSYMAPEQFRGAPTDPRTDVYAAGATLYEMLTGRPPFEAETIEEVMNAHLGQPPALPSTGAPERGIHSTLDRVVQRALDKNPEDRYASMADMAIDLWDAIEAIDQERLSGSRDGQTGAVAPSLYESGLEEKSEQTGDGPSLDDRSAGEPGVGPGALDSAHGVEPRPARPRTASGTDPSREPTVALQEPGEETGEISDLSGTVLSGRYLLERRIGEGGMGVVYRAKHMHMHKTVAIKILHPELTAVDEVVKRFEREAQAVANIDHPHVCGATDFGRAESGAFFLVMEYLEGRALDEVLKEQGRLPVRRALHVARQICSALERAHEMGIVHRDMKPENVLLVERDGDPSFVKVLDFGIARVPVDDSASKTLTRAGMVIGTPAYLSPEQATGLPTSHATDLYSLGITLFEMVAGKRPFESSSAVELLGMHATKPPPRLDRFAPAAEVPSRLERLVRALLAKEPHQRPQSASAVRDELEAIDGEVDSSAILKTLGSSKVVEALSERAGPAASRMSRAAAEGVGKVVDALSVRAGPAASRMSRATTEGVGKVVEALSERAGPTTSRMSRAAAEGVGRLRRLPLWAWPLLLVVLVVPTLFLAVRDDGGGEAGSDDVLPDDTPSRPADPVEGKTPQKPTKSLIDRLLHRPSKLEALRDRPDVAKALALGPSKGDAAVVKALRSLYRAEQPSPSPELAFLLGEAEAAAGMERLALQHAQEALDGDEELAGTGEMRSFVLGELRSSRNAALAARIVTKHYMPDLVEAVAEMACDEDERRLRERAQGILITADALDQVERWCMLSVQLDNAGICEARRQLIVAMGELGDPRALPALKRVPVGSKRRFFRRVERNACLRTDIKRVRAQLVQRAGRQAPTDDDD